jgi:hypothetical protein
MSTSSIPFERTQLLESLTVPQLRDIALTGRLDEASVNGARTKDALKKLIQVPVISHGYGLPFTDSKH